MLGTLTIESFEPHVGTPFSLFFLGPVLLPQQIYRLTHDAFAEPTDIFLVPIAGGANGFTYEAVFT